MTTDIKDQLRKEIDIIRGQQRKLEMLSKRHLSSWKGGLIL